MSEDEKVWSIRVPPNLDESVEESVSENTHKTKSELVRDAVRRHLEESKHKKIGDKCKDCGATENLQTHHISYEPERTVTLCVDCHKKRHGHGVGRAGRGSSKRILTLSNINRTLLEKVKKISSKKGIPLSRLVEKYFDFLTKREVYCFECGKKFSAKDTKTCPKCGWMKCPECGACGCELSDEVKSAAFQMRKVYEDLIGGRVK